MRKTRVIHLLPGVTLTLHLSTARKGCEHACFLGATADLVGFLAHIEAPFVVLAGKLAFVAGAFGIYLLHAEEAAEMRRLSGEPIAEDE